MARCFCACHEFPGTYPPPCGVCGHHNDHGRYPGSTRMGWVPDGEDVGPLRIDAGPHPDEMVRLLEALDTAESVAQMAAHDRDEALENFARVEQEYGRLQDAARSILWMAQAYAEGGGSGGPEMQDYEAAAEIIGED